jgi:CBS domain-containing protein
LRPTFACCASPPSPPSSAPVIGDLLAPWLPGAEPRLLGIVSRSDLIKATAGLHTEEHERRTLRTAPLIGQLRGQGRNKLVWIFNILPSIHVR